MHAILIFNWGTHIEFHYCMSFLKMMFSSMKIIIMVYLVNFHEKSKSTEKNCVTHLKWNIMHTMTIIEVHLFKGHLGLLKQHSFCALKPLLFAQLVTFLQK